MKRGWIVVAVVVVALPTGVIGAASWLLNGEAIKLRLTEQVRRATGRELTIAGPVTLAWSLTPTIALNDVTLANPPGFSRPEMAHVDRVEARIGLGGLFNRRITVDRVAIVSPWVRLERDAAGRPNWVFTPPTTPATSPAPPSAPRSDRFALALGAVDITNATVDWGTQRVAAPHLAYDPRDGAVSGDLVAAGATLALTGAAGPIGAGPVPLDLHLTGAGLVAELGGTSEAARLSILAADLAALSPLAGRALPSVHDVALSLTVPGPSAIQLRFGATSIGGLTLQSGTLSAASLTDPATIAATGVLGATPITLTGHVGSIDATSRGPVPLDARIEAADAVLTAQGALATTGTGTLQVRLTAPDLRPLGVGVQALDATASLALRPGAVDMTGLRLTSAQGDLAGHLALAYAGRPSLRGVLTSTRLEWPTITPIASPAVTPPTVPAPQPATPAKTGRLIPDTALPLGPLRASDADLQLNAASLQVAGISYTGVALHAVLANGTLRVDPATAAFGSTIAHVTLEVQAAAAPPAIHATIAAPGLPFGAMMALAGGMPDATGTLDLDVDLTGTGTTVRAVASTLSGHAGLALVDGQLDNALLERAIGGVLRRAGVSFNESGRTEIRCAAFRADAAAGTLQFSALTLDTAKLALDGSGDVDLGTEQLDLHLRPQVRLGGGLSVPLRVRGTLSAPKVELDPGAIASGRVGILLGGPTPPDRCGPALAVARGGQAGPAAAPARATKPADLLRGLLR